MGGGLADHYITMDNLYHRRTNVHWKVLLRLKEQGRLGLFNLGAWHHPPNLKPETCEKWKREHFARFDAVYEKAKRYGLLDHAYIYGCDECGPDTFPAIAFGAGELKARYPGVPLMTTSFDYAFGTKDSPLAKIDWFTPDIEHFPKFAANIPPARAAGGNEAGCGAGRLHRARIAVRRFGTRPRGSRGGDDVDTLGESQFGCQSDYRRLLQATCRDTR